MTQKQTEDNLTSRYLRQQENIPMDKHEPIERLDNITRKAASLFKVPIAMINLVTPNTVLFKSCTGLARGDRVDRNGSFCSLASSLEEPLVVSDATLDPRFKHNPLVEGPLKIRSYAGKSLHAPDGTRLGTLCLLDTKPRKYSIKQLRALCDLAEEASEGLHTIIKLGPGKAFIQKNS